MDLIFRVSPARSDITREVIEGLESEILKMVADRLGGGSKSWLEAGGYVKWAKGAAELLPIETIDPLSRLADLSDLQRIAKF